MSDRTKAAISSSGDNAPDQPLSAWADEDAKRFGLPDTWREDGWDTPEYMVSAESLYHVRDDDDRPTGEFKCPFPHCSFRTRGLRTIFRHAHDPANHREADRG